MIIRHATKHDIQQALDKTQPKYNNNLSFNRFDSFGKAYRVTLRVKDSKLPGHKISFNALPFGGKPRRLASACWHVHGDFFDSLISIAPEATITTAWAKRISKRGDNWKDFNIGCSMYPQYASDACDCT